MGFAHTPLLAFQFEWQQRGGAGIPQMIDNDLESGFLLRLS